MGLIAEAFSTALSIIPERRVSVGTSVKVSAGAAIEPWDSGTPRQQREALYRYMVDGYSSDEVFYACTEELASSAAEPRLVAVRKAAKGKPEQIQDHPVLDVFEHPNPFTSGYDLIAGLIMWRFIAGNAYIEKVRSAAGKLVEFWPLRPDRMWVIPDEARHIRGWEYRLGAQPYPLRVDDVVHVHTRLVMDDYYGMPPARPAAMRIDTAAAMRSFTQAFFRNAGIPAGLLTFEKQIGKAEEQIVRDRFRNDYSGANAFGVLPLGGIGQGNTVTYTPMGLPLGERGLVMPELDEILDAKTAMVFGVPLELLGARLGMIHGNRSTTKEARAGFWDETLMPLYKEIAATLTMSLQPEYGDFDYLEFDTSTVQALQEDENAKTDRLVKQMHAGGISVQEFRTAIGREPEFEPGALLVMPDNISGLPADQLDVPPAPVPMTQPALGGRTNGTSNGSLTAREKEVLRS